MTTFGGLCLDLFLLGHAHLAEGQAGQGAAFERRVRAHLDVLGLPTARGFRVFGRQSLSGAYHQLDEHTACQDTVIVGEWKAYRGQIPKNDLLRFKAATDDYWLAGVGHFPVPLVRIFGGTGTASESMKVYAAQWGIVLITPTKWPIPALRDPSLLWSLGDVDRPSAADLRTLGSLVRPIGDLLIPQMDGSWRIPRMPNSREISGRLAVWQFWSDRAWEFWDERGRGRFDALVESRIHRTAAA